MPLIKLTSKRFKEYGKNEFDINPILLGTEQIIKVERTTVTSGSFKLECTQIASVGAMVTTNYVTETIEEIEKIIKKAK